MSRSYPGVGARRTTPQRSYKRLFVGACKMMLLFFVLLIPGAFVAQTSPLGGGLLALVALAVTGWYAEVVKARAGF